MGEVAVFEQRVHIGLVLPNLSPGACHCHSWDAEPQIVPLLIPAPHNEL